MSDENQPGVSRRTLLGYVGFLGASTGVGLAATKKALEGDDGESNLGEMIPTIEYDPDRVYDGDPNGTDFTPDPDRDPVDTWDEALPVECSLSADERHWLVSRVDSYEELEGEDFFEYVDEEVRLYDTGSELRMEVDADYDGTEFEPDTGYNIPDVC
jgi:hypothetical protein